MSCYEFIIVVVKSCVKVCIGYKFQSESVNGLQIIYFYWISAEYKLDIDYLAIKNIFEMPV